MPNLNMLKKPMPNKPLTNQELLTELERRIENGTINLEFDTKQVELPEETSETKIFGLNKSTLLLGVVLVMGLMFYSQSQKTTLPVQLQTVVKINEASSPQPPLN